MYIGKPLHNIERGDKLYLNIYIFRRIDPEFSINNLLTRFGEHDLESTDEPHSHIDRKVEKVIKHPKWMESSGPNNDIALLKLTNPVDYDVNIIPICLPPGDNKLVGEIAWVKGWGRLYEGKYNGYAW